MWPTLQSLKSVTNSRVLLRSSAKRTTSVLRRNFRGISSSLDGRLKYSYCQGDQDQPLLGDTLGQRFDKTVEEFPDREAYVFCESNERATFSKFKQEVDQLSEGFLSRGLTRGDRLGVWAPNIREWILTQFAAARTGLVVVTMNPAYEVPEAEFVIKKAGCKAVLIADQFRTQNYYDMMTKMVPELPDAKPGELKNERLPELRDVFFAGKSNQSHKGTTSFQELMSSGGQQEKQQLKDLQRTIQFDDPLCIQFTSGTTGHPKGVFLCHHSVVNNAFQIGRNLKYNEPTRVCVPLPLFHAFGYTAASIVCLMYGSTAVYPSRGYNVPALLQAIHNEKCNSLYGTPPMFIDILANPDLHKYDLSSLKKGITGATTCPTEVMKQIVTKLSMSQLTLAYGLTEVSPLVTQTPLDESLELRVSTVGKVVPHVEIKIVDSEGKIVPVSTPGEICIRGYCVMLGYWKEREQTDKAIEPSRWFHSGDLGTMDENGYIRFVGRLKDMISRGGENVYPAEIEQFLHSHPKIQDVQIIGVPDERLCEDVCAWIKLKDGESATAQEIKDYCKGQIAYFKIPRYIKFVDEYPMTASGKVMKYVMRQQAEKEYKSYST